MKIDLNTNILSTNDNRFIKRLLCPHVVKWDEFGMVENNPAIRLCDKCKYPVVDTVGMTDEQVLKLVSDNQSTCLKVSMDQQNIEREDSLRYSEKHHLRVIKTESRVPVINSAVKCGFRALVLPYTFNQETNRNSQIEEKLDEVDQLSSSFCVIQHIDTGEIASFVCYGGCHIYSAELRQSFNTMDVISVMGEKYNIVIDWSPQFISNRYHPSDFAAYLLPEDLVVGERVFLESLIEEVVISYPHLAARRSRLGQCEAIWNGNRFELDYRKQKEYARTIYG